MASETGKRTEETLPNHLQAFGSSDVDAIMADYDERTPYSSPPEGTLRGSGEIRTLFEKLVADLPRGSAAEDVSLRLEG